MLLYTLNTVDYIKVQYSTVMYHSVGFAGFPLSRAELSKAEQFQWMDRGCLLAVQGAGMFGEDYQVFTPDGRAVGQVLVLGPMDAAAGGKQGQL